MGGILELGRNLVPGNPQGWSQLKLLPIVDRVPVLALSCNQIFDSPTCHQRAVIQKLRVADVEIHSQALGEGSNERWRERKDCMNQGRGWGCRGYDTGTKRDSWPETEWNLPRGSAYVWHLHNLVRSRPVPGTWADFWEPIHHAGLPCPPWYRGRSLLLSQLEVPCFDDSQGRSAPFWMERREEWMAGSRKEVGEGTEEREEKLWPVFKINKKNFF